VTASAVGKQTGGELARVVEIIAVAAGSRARARVPALGQIAADAAREVLSEGVDFARITEAPLALGVTQAVDFDETDCSRSERARAEHRHRRLI